MHLRELVEQLYSMRDSGSEKSDVFVAIAPGRINLIGEHTDYNEGFVMPVSINLHTIAVGSKRKDDKLKVKSLNLKEEYEKKIWDLKPSGDWHSYVEGCIYQLLKREYQVRGVEIVLWGNIPLGGGLSSSASLEVAVVKLISEIFSLYIDSLEIAQISQKAENEFVGVPCGIMDQLTAVFGEKGKALFIDCRTWEIQKVDFPSDYSIIAVDSGVKHQLSSSNYAKRRQECEEAVRIIKKNKKNYDISSLRDVNEDILREFENRMPEVIFKRAKFVIEENTRVIKFKEALGKKDRNNIFELMKNSHQGLRVQYEVSCEELDFLVHNSWDFKYTIGARMTGGGFGGNIVALIEKGHEDEYTIFISEKFKQRFGTVPKIYFLEIQDGVRAFKINGMEKE